MRVPRALGFVSAALLGLIVVPAAGAQNQDQDHPGADPYQRVCQLCHGVGGRGDLAPALVPLGFDAEYVLAVVREGYSQMPPISRRELSDDEVREVVAYLGSLSSTAPAASASSYDRPPATSRSPTGRPLSSARPAPAPHTNASCPFASAKVHSRDLVARRVQRREGKLGTARRLMAEQFSVARRFPRAIVNLTTEVVVERDEASTSVDGRFLILGGGGAWIEMAGQYPIDSEVALRFKLPRRATGIACRAVVRNHLHRRGAGVEFVDITPDDRASVIAFVAREPGGGSPVAAG